MPIVVNCDCGQTMLVKDEWAGRRARCPMCKQPLTVPDPSKGRRGPVKEDVIDAEEIIDAEPVEPRPSRVTTKPKAPPRREAEEEVIDAEIAEDDRPSRVQTRPKPKAKLQRDEDEEDDRPRRRRDDDDDEDDRPRRGSGRVDDRPVRRKKTTEPGNFGTTDAGMWGGLVMMLIAVVWFGLGLLADRIFIYPPILLVLGLIAFVKGLMSR